MKPILLLAALAGLASAEIVKETIAVRITHSLSNIHMGIDSIKGISGASVQLRTGDSTASATTDSAGWFYYVRYKVGVAPTAAAKPSLSYAINQNRITFENGDIARVELFDIRGRSIFTASLQPGEKSVAIPADGVGYRLIRFVSRSGAVETRSWISGSAVASTPKQAAKVNTRSRNSNIEPIKKPDSLFVKAAGYPELKIPVDIETLNGDSYPMIDSSRGSAKEIVIFNCGRRTIQDTVFGEGLHTVLYDVHVNYPFGNQGTTAPWGYSVDELLIAQAKGYYSSILRPQDFIQYFPAFSADSKNCTTAQYTSFADLDTIPNYTTSITGAVILTEYENTSNVQFSGSYKAKLCFPYPNGYEDSRYRVILCKADSITPIDTAVVGILGRYQFANVPEGSYVLKLEGWDREEGGTVPINTNETRNADFCGRFYAMTVAPNIYLYPEQKSTIDVKVNILATGTIPFSIPTYNGGWSVTATPEGRINDSLGFLYYDFYSSIPYQSDSGWVLSYANFDKEVTELLAARGLNKQEIWDFIDFWKKYIPACDWVTLCPINADRMVELTVAPAPMTLFRELYLVLPTKGERPTIKEPARGVPFERKGFTVVEWGGHLEGLKLDQVIADKKK